MRVLLWADMEGMSRIADHRECWPEFPPYWQTGRRTFTGEVVAAATGLLHGGASAVLVVNGHGLGWPNVLWDELPERVAPADNNTWSEGFDAMFQAMARRVAGTPSGSSPGAAGRPNQPRRHPAGPGSPSRCRRTRT
jgi:D-aminopeptidase